MAIKIRAIKIRANKIGDVNAASFVFRLNGKTGKRK
jgi:hypothetical protein